VYGEHIRARVFDTADASDENRRCCDARLMGRQIELGVGDLTVRYELLELLAPKTTAALWAHLPAEGRLYHGRLSGDSAIWGIRGDAMKELRIEPTSIEAAVTSIYKGFIVAAVYPASGLMDLTISYGKAELRRDNGRSYGTPVAEIVGDGTAFFALMKNLRAEGQKQMTVKRVA
jgi:hypothetical protein